MCTTYVRVHTTSTTTFTTLVNPTIRDHFWYLYYRTQVFLGSGLVSMNKRGVVWDAQDWFFFQKLSCCREVSDSIAWVRYASGNVFSLCRGLENVTRSGLENGPLLFMQPPRLCFCYTFDRVNTAEKADLLLYTVYAHLSQRKCSQAPTGALPFSIPPIKCGFGSQILATINTSSVWSTLIIAMNSHLFIAMINVDHADDMLKDWWWFMITYIIMSSWKFHDPYQKRWKQKSALEQRKIYKITQKNRRKLNIKRRKKWSNQW